MALKRQLAVVLSKAEPPTQSTSSSKDDGPNADIGEKPIDAPVGYAPRVVKVPMHKNADVNPNVHAAKQEEKKQRDQANASPSSHDKEGSQNMTTKSVPSATLVFKGGGEGSRGGKVVRHTKGGKPVYSSQAQAQAEQADKMMTKWHQNADKSNNPEHHAIAAKQALHAAYFHHHAGDEVSSHQAMDYANHHRAAYEKAGHKSRTTTAIDKLHHTTAHEVGHAGWQPEEHGLSAEHSVAQDARMSGDKKTADKLRNQSPEHQAAGKYEVKPIKGTQAYSAHHIDAQGKRTPLGGTAEHPGVHPGKNFADNAVSNHKTARAGIKKAITPSNSNGGTMSKGNEIADLFKSELGESNAIAQPITSCVHCHTMLTREDLSKGLGDLKKSFVADDNDNPSSGGSGQVEPSRPAPGVAENDVIAPLLKSCKGSEAGDGEEYPISKSEMLEMGMNADSLDEGWYTITKSEMMKQAPNYLAYLVDRKTRISKSMKPNVQVRKSVGGDSRIATDGPHGYTPRAGGAHGAGGEPLVQWYKGSDQATADYIEKSGSGFGPGTDESIRTQGRGDQ
jgi:hypothetical protein